jgi:hypothetical protein
MQGVMLLAVGLGSVDSVTGRERCGGNRNGHWFKVRLRPRSRLGAFSYGGSGTPIIDVATVKQVPVFAMGAGTWGEDPFALTRHPGAVSARVRPF